MIFWPPFSPDLNPIERIWHIMKNYLQNNFPGYMTPTVLRSAVTEAWEKVGEFEFRALTESTVIEILLLLSLPSSLSFYSSSPSLILSSSSSLLTETHADTPCQAQDGPIQK
jgi:hypothetical protein